MVKRWLINPVWQTRISFRIFLKIQHAHGQKMINLQLWQTRISFKFFLKIQHTLGEKMIDPAYDRPGCHLEYLSKIQHVYGQKMIEPPKVWQTRVSPTIFFKRSTCT